VSNNFAHLKKESPFYPVFEAGRVPIQNILIPEMGVMEGDKESQPQEFYRVDLEKLSQQERRRLCVMIADQCHGTPAEVWADLGARGFIPLRALHVECVSSDSRAFL